MRARNTTPVPIAPKTPRMTPVTIAGAALAGALIALAFGATSAAAQAYAPDGTYVDEVVVTPSHYRANPNRLSRVISIRDLDLRTTTGRDVLRLRIRDTARDICHELGEDRFSGSMTSSCQEQAIRDARPQVRLATRQAWTNRSYAYLDQPYPYDFRVEP